MKSLKYFLEVDLHIDLSTPTYYETNLCGGLNGLSDLLESHFIIRCENYDLRPFVPTDRSHKLIVDQCVHYLLSKKMYGNVLTHGYRLGATTNVNSALHCVSVNFAVSAIKSTPWRLFHELIGTNHFIDIIVNCAVFRIEGGKYIQISGNRLYFPNYKPATDTSDSGPQKRYRSLIAPVRVRCFLYRNSSGFNAAEILPPVNECSTFRREIFDVCLERNRTLQLQVNRILRKVLHNHHTKIKYSHILDNICPRTRATSHINSRSTPAQVTRFLVVILEKLFSPEVFGSKRNKAVIFKHMASMLKLPIRGSLSMANLGDSLRLTDFSWLTLTSNKLTKHEFERSSILLRAFVSWLFRYLIPKIIATFFYCTEISSFVDICYFRHDVWNQMSLPYLDSYLKSHMVENSICRNHYSYLLSRFNHNKARIIPKKAEGEFRIIAVPSKGVGSEEFNAYNENLRSIIHPTQCMLDYLRNKRNTHFEKVHSASHIVGHIQAFKDRLLKKFKRVPKLHFLKFDIDSCYDSIPRERVLSVVKNLLEKENGFFVRSNSFHNPATNSFCVQNVVNGWKRNQQEELLIDNVKTLYFSNEDLLSILQSEMYNSSLTLSSKCYHRRSGLFQGSSLSGPLVDLVYDDLLEHYDHFHPKEGDDSLVLRLADDFLIISTDEARIRGLRELALHGFGRFNARVNINKMICSISKEERRIFSFCALEILIDDLEIKKTPDSLTVPDIRASSAAKTYRRLLGLFEMRLSYGVADLSLNSKKTVLGQIRLITKNIAEAYAQAFQRRRINVHSFAFFTYRMKILAVRASHEESLSSEFITQLCLAITECFFDTLSPIHAKFVNVIVFLKNDIKKLRHVLD